MTVKRDRDEVFLEYTKSICPVCKVVVDAQINIRDGKVYLRKRCREHGGFEALVYGDAQAYLDSARFNKPGTIPLTFQTEVVDGCPSDCWTASWSPAGPRPPRTMAGAAPSSRCCTSGRTSPGWGCSRCTGRRPARR